MIDRLVVSSLKDRTYYIHQNYHPTTTKTDSADFERGLFWSCSDLQDRTNWERSQHENLHWQIVFNQTEEIKCSQWIVKGSKIYPQTAASPSTYTRPEAWLCPWEFSCLRNDSLSSWRWNDKWVEGEIASQWMKQNFVLIIVCFFLSFSFSFFHL